MNHIPLHTEVELLSRIIIFTSSLMILQSSELYALLAAVGMAASNTQGEVDWRKLNFKSLKFTAGLWTCCSKTRIPAFHLSLFTSRFIATCSSNSLSVELGKIQLYLHALGGVLALWIPWISQYVCGGRRSRREWYGLIFVDVRGSSARRPLNSLRWPEKMLYSRPRRVWYWI
jgi:hypothetical protein